MTAKKKVLIYRLGSLGDTIIALPCFHLIKATYPDADITLLTNKPISSKAAPLQAILGDGGFFFNKIISYPVGTRNPFTLFWLLLKLKLRKIDVLINISAARTRRAASRDRFFFRLAGIKEMWGFPEAENDFSVALDPMNNEYEWEAERLARRLVKLGTIDLENERFWDLKFQNDELLKASIILKSTSNSPKIVICPGTKMQAKDWGLANWCGLLSSIGDKLSNWTLIVIGAEEEFNLGQKCLQAWPGEGINLCGKTSPRVSAAILQKSQIFVGHDSGPMHLAGCIGTPLVAIFSGINLPKQWFPRGKNNDIIYHKTECSGCKLQTCLKENKKCILSISINEVETTVLNRLAKINV